MQDEVTQAADLLTKAIGDISAALTMAGKADKITEWTAPYVAAVNAMDEQAERDTLARMEWRDIESAPKDWTDVLVFSPEHEGFNCGGVFSAFYDTDEACWFTHAPGHNIRLNPTHWMPLPPAPVVGQ